MINELKAIALEYNLIFTEDLSKFIHPPIGATGILFEYYGGTHIKIFAFLRGENLFRPGYYHLDEDENKEFLLNLVDLNKCLNDYFT